MCSVWVEKKTWTTQTGRDFQFNRMKWTCEIPKFLPRFQSTATACLRVPIFGCRFDSCFEHMGTDEAEVAAAEVLPYMTTPKVHRFICKGLINLVGLISVILPKIEAARPGCSSGVQALCHLSRANDKSKSFLMSCCESSKLYLALRGNVLVSRCNRWRNLMEQSLIVIQNMVPVLLSAEISRVLDVVRSVTFTLDSYEEEAGNALKELVYHNASHPDLRDKYEVQALQIAASRLHLNSQKALLIEKRSIKKMLSSITNSELKKRELLVYLIGILAKHGTSMVGEKIVVSSPRTETCSASTPYLSESAKCSRTETVTKDLPPIEMTCSISSRIMFEPVVIASGQTFERVWIEKWFAEGHSICPKTKMELSNLSWTPNSAIKDLISKWCRARGVTVPDPSVVSDEDACCASVTSLSSSFTSLHLPNDMSNVSMDSLDSYCSKSEVSSGLEPSCTSSDSPRSQSGSGTTAQEGFPDRFSKLPFYSWESQLQILKEAEANLKSRDGSLMGISSSSLIDSVIRFLKDACDFHDLHAQKAGSQLLLTFVQEERDEIPNLSGDVYGLLADMLRNSTEEVLNIMEILSGYKNCRLKLVESGALSSLVSFLDESKLEHSAPAVKILYNVCLDDANHSEIVAMEEVIPRLNCFLRNSLLSKFAIFIMKSLCYLEKAQISIMETEGCISAIAELLESGTHEEQENAVFILRSLCSEHTQCCRKVMNEGVIPSLFNISVNGSKKGKTDATELLYLLRDTDFSDEHDHRDESHPRDEYRPVNYSEEPKSENLTSKAENPTTKLSGVFGKRFTKLSKPSFLIQKWKKYM